MFGILSTFLDQGLAVSIGPAKCPNESDIDIWVHNGAGDFVAHQTIRRDEGYSNPEELKHQVTKALQMIAHDLIINQQELIDALKSSSALT